MNYEVLSAREEQTGTAIVNAAFRIHKELGRGCSKKFMKYAWPTNSEKQGLV